MSELNPPAPAAITKAALHGLRKEQDAVIKKIKLLVGLPPLGIAEVILAYPAAQIVQNGVRQSARRKR